MAGKPRAYQGQILIYRNGLPFRDYGDTRVTTDDYGTGFLAACAALADDDILVLGPGIFTCVNATIAAARVKVIANGTIIQKKAATNYTHLLKITGDDCVIDGLVVDGTGVSNTGTGYGIHITGDRTRILNCEANGSNGTTATNGDGTALYCYQAADTLIKDYRSYNAEYSAIWLNGCSRTYIDGVYVVDSNNRSLSITGNVTGMDLVTVNDFHAVAVTEGCSVTWNTNVFDTYELGELRISNVSLTDSDMISAGVSYNDADGHQMFKVQNISKVLMDNVSLVHGHNSGAGVARTMHVQSYLDNTPPNELIMRNCTFADTVSFGLKIPYLLAEDCRFGSRKITTDYNELFYYMRAEHAEFVRCQFTQEAKPQVFELGSDTADTDRYIFRGCYFESNSASSTYIMNQSDDEDLTTLAGCFVCDDTNTLNNVGAGTMYRSDNVHGNLILTTDANGDMLFDDTIMSTQKIVSFYCTTGTSSGTFTVTYSGQVTSALAYNVSAANLKAAIEALSNVDLVTVTGSGTQGSPWVVTFQGKLDGINTAPTTTGVDLVGGTVTSPANVQSAVSLGKHPQPGSGPAYFPGLDAPANGKRIWNINWSPDATQVVPEKGWISHGGEWKEMT